MTDKIIPFPGKNQILLNAMAIAMENNLDIVLTIKDQKGNTYHITNTEQAQHILKASLES
jgi:hypothetical protein